MITIAISELKKFLHNSKYIKDRGVLPILSYVKLQCHGEVASLTKSNLNSFVVTEIDAHFNEDYTILIEEKSLAGCVNFSKGEEVKISIEGKNVIMDDGETITKCQAADIKTFPSVEFPEDPKKYRLDTEVISSLTLANGHTLAGGEKGLLDWKYFVHIIELNKKKCVAGANGPISYFKYFKGDLPTFSLESDVVTIISRFPELEYFSSDRYNYFTCLDTTFGFIKAEIKLPELDSVISKFKSNDSFVVNRKEVIRLCEAAMFMNSSSLAPEVSLKEEDGKLALTFEDNSGSRGKRQFLPFEKKTFEVTEIIFQPKNMITVLSSLDSEKVKISKIFGNMVITTDEDKSYIGSVMELARLIPQSQPA
jgi:DNA polymerase III sliding clamp (beta) subunit (PCNA family)